MRLPDSIRPYFSKVVASIIILALVWLGVKFNIAILSDPKVQAEIVLVVLTWLGLATTHTAVSAKTNPGNAATPTLAGESKVITELNKAQKDNQL
jgi:hypothetical protein